MVLATRYRQDRLKASGYDAIVIGSGIGGLTTAALMAKEGKSVCVLEKHYTMGGFTHAFRRKRFAWDVGVHYIGEVHRPHSILRKIFDDISESRIQWHPMPKVYDRGFFPDRSYDFVAGKEEWLDSLKTDFPNETRVIDRYLQTVLLATKESQGFFTAKALPGILSPLLTPFLSRKFDRFARKTVYDTLAELGCSPRLNGVLSTQWGDYGLRPKLASFAIHAMIVKHYLAGGAYPVGGAGAIAEGIAPTITQAGGDIFVRAGVKKILCEGNRCLGVEMETGDQIQAPIVISNAGVINTFTKLLGQNPGIYGPQLSKVEASTGHFCLYLGMDKTDAELETDACNQWIFPSYDHDQNVVDFLADKNKPFPGVYISFPSAKDPKWSEEYPNRATCEVVSLAPFEWFSKWQQSKPFGRGEGYTEFKEQFQQRLLDVLYQYNPRLKGELTHIEMSTPLSTQFYANYSQGEIYGIDHSPLRFQQRWLKPQTPIKNLYLTGQDIVTDGVGGALFAGVLSSSVVLKRNVIGDILKRSPAP